jgi:hypothetical protein
MHNGLYENSERHLRESKKHEIENKQKKERDPKF